MADTFQLNLVSPERQLASVDATEVQIPAKAGQMTAMAGHAPTITTLKPGLLTVTHAGGSDDYVVSGGFAEIGADAVSVLAERALPKAELTQEVFDAMLSDARAEAEKAREGGEDGAYDAMMAIVGDITAIGEEVGLAARA